MVDPLFCDGILPIHLYDMKLLIVKSMFWGLSYSILKIATEREASFSSMLSLTHSVCASGYSLYYHYYHDDDDDD